MLVQGRKTKGATAAAAEQAEKEKTLVLHDNSLGSIVVSINIIII